MERWLPRPAVMDFRFLATLGMTVPGLLSTPSPPVGREIQRGDSKSLSKGGEATQRGPYVRSRLTN